MVSGADFADEVLPDHRDVPQRLFRFLAPLSDRLITILLENRFYLCRPDLFNDPFDSRAIVLPLEDPEARYQHACAESQRLGVETTPEHLERFRDTEWSTAHVQTRFERTRENLGICCFCDQVEGPLLWTHYAANHTGVALGFSMLALLQMDGDSPFPVDYQADYPRFRFPASHPSEEMARAPLTKRTHWEYEREWRIYRPNGAGGYQPFPPHALESLYLGCRASPEFKRTVATLLRARAALGNSPLRVYQARISATSYELEYDHLSRL